MNDPTPSPAPRLSEASSLLRAIHLEVEAEAARCALPVALDLLPVVDHDVFGYELLPDHQVDTLVIVGRNADGPVVRQTTYGGTSPGAARLAAVNGRPGTWRAYVPRTKVERRDDTFVHWRDAAAAAIAAFNALLRGHAATTTQLRELHPGLERALSWASDRLSGIDPRIQFFGLLNEAQMGFPLSAENGVHGKLSLEHDDAWTLQWSGREGTRLETLSPGAASLVRSHIPGAVQLREERRGRDRRASDRRAIDNPMRPPVDRRQVPGRRVTDRDR